MEHLSFLFIFMPGSKAADLYRLEEIASGMAAPFGLFPVCLDLGDRFAGCTPDDPDTILAHIRKKRDSHGRFEGTTTDTREIISAYLAAFCPRKVGIMPARGKGAGQDGSVPEVGTFISRRCPGTEILVLETGDEEKGAPAASDFRKLDLVAGSAAEPGPGPSGLDRIKPFFRVWPQVFQDPDLLAGLLGYATRAVPGQAGFVFQNQGLSLAEWVSILSPWFRLKGRETGFSLQACGAADHEFLEGHMAGLFDQGLRMIEWQALSGEGPELPRSLMWQASKLGIWNHVTGTNLFAGGQGAWLANAPNIAHSLQDLDQCGPDQDSPDNTGRLQANLIPEEISGYGKVTPFPHFPFWQILGEPSAILGLLGRISKNDLLRLRIGKDLDRICRLGENLRFEYLKPSQIDRATMDEIVAMVDAGGSVDITHVRANLEKAYLIALATEDGVIVGNSSLKHPRPAFIERINRISGLDFSGFVERGYTSVRPEYRAMGIGAKLLEGLTERAVDVKVFSIISEDNLATQKIAERNRTKKILTYQSEKLGKAMGIWMPEHMIETQWEILP